MIVRDIYIQNTDPAPSDAQRGGLLWLNASSGRWFQKTDTGYISIPFPTIITEDIEFTGKAKFSGQVYAEDKKGENATVTIPGVGTLKFKHGIMHEFST